MSGELIKEKAVFLYIRRVPNKFKTRFRIRLLKTTGEKLSCDIELFKKKLIKNIEELNLTPDQICKTDESRLFWRLTKKRLFTSAPHLKISKDQSLVCSVRVLVEHTNYCY